MRRLAKGKVPLSAFGADMARTNEEPVGVCGMAVSVTVLPAPVTNGLPRASSAVTTRLKGLPVRRTGSAAVTTAGGSRVNASPASVAVWVMLKGFVDTGIRPVEPEAVEIVPVTRIV